MSSSPLAYAYPPSPSSSVTGGARSEAFSPDGRSSSFKGSVMLKRKPIAISLAGTDVPIFLLDGTALVLRITPTTTAAACLISIRDKLGLKYDRHYALFESNEAEFRYIEDTYPVAKVIQKWSQDGFFDTGGGGRKLYFKRWMRCPESCTETEETENMAAHNLVFADCVYHYLYGHYRFTMPVVVQLAGLLLQATKGGYDKLMDAPGRVRTWIEYLVPAYAVTDLFTNNSSNLTHPRTFGGLGKCDAAVSADDLTRHIVAAYAYNGVRSQFEAAKEFIRVVKEKSPVYGNEFFICARTWKEQEQQPDGSYTEVAKTEKVCLSAGYDGIYLLGMSDPLAIEIHDINEIGKWMTSRDGKIFAFTLEDEKVVYVMTDAASYIEKTIEEYVEARVRVMTAAAAAEEQGVPLDPLAADTSAVPRSASDQGVGEPISFTPVLIPAPAIGPWVVVVGGGGSGSGIDPTAPLTATSMANALAATPMQSITGSSGNSSSNSNSSLSLLSSTSVSPSLYSGAGNATPMPTMSSTPTPTVYSPPAPTPLPQRSSITTTTAAASGSASSSITQGVATKVSLTGTSALATVTGSASIPSATATSSSSSSSSSSTNNNNTSKSGNPGAETEQPEPPVTANIPTTTTAGGHVYYTSLRHPSTSSSSSSSSSSSTPSWLGSTSGSSNNNNRRAAEPLPEGWLEIPSSSSSTSSSGGGGGGGTVYYYHAVKGITQWERPSPPGLVAVTSERLPQGWAAALDRETGDVYYFCEATDEVQWEKPEFPEENVAYGWTVLYDDDGDAYFWNETTGATTWDKPRARLPPPSANAAAAALAAGNGSVGIKVVASTTSSSSLNSKSSTSTPGSPLTSSSSSSLLPTFRPSSAANSSARVTAAATNGVTPSKKLSVSATLRKFAQ